MSLGRPVEKGRADPSTFVDMPGIVTHGHKVEGYGNRQNRPRCHYVTRPQGPERNCRRYGQKMIHGLPFCDAHAEKVWARMTTVLQQCGWREVAKVAAGIFDTLEAKSK